MAPPARDRPRIYTYRPLESDNHIRLLKVVANWPEHEDGWTATFELVHVSLADAPPYTTLSYVWGKKPKFDKTIPLVSGEVLALTETLQTALLQVISHVGEDALLWADQVCIDQRRTAEKQQQVAIMGQIYMRAERVLVCLGLTSWVMEFMELVDEVRALPEDRRSEEDKKGAVAGLVDVVSFQSDKWARVRAVQKVLDRPWFRRAWVFQECILSRQVDLVLGTHLVSWEEFNDVVDAVFQIQYDQSGYRRSLAKTTSGYEPLLGMQKGREPLPAPRNVWNFVETILNAIDDYDATDPRDHIFAFLGLPWGERLGLKPDYLSSVEQVYLQTTRRVIESLGDLRILSHAVDSGGKKNKRLPSWCVDWADKSVRTGVIFSASRSSSFRACASYRHPKVTQPQPLPLDVQGQITLHGKIIDTIEWLSSHAFEKHYFMAASRSYLNLDKNLRDVTSHLPRRGGGGNVGEVTRGRLLKVLLADLAWESEHQVALTAASLAECLAAYDDWGKIEKSKRGNRHEGRLHQVQQASLVAQQMRVARCAAGKLALVLKICRPGDLVCVLHGSAAPVVLRKKEGAGGPGGRARYRYISQAYYEDVMYGERVDWKEDEADEFVLI